MNDEILAGITAVCTPLGEVAGADLQPLAIGAKSGLLWSRNGMLLAGLGEVGRIPVGRPDNVSVAQVTLAAIAGDNQVGGPGTGPVGFGAFPFDRERPGELIVPHIVVGQRPDGAHWLTVIDLSVDDAILQLQNLVGEKSETPQATSYHLQSVVTPEHWRDDVVAVVRSKIVGELNKVVLARELRLTTNAPIDTEAALRRLDQSFGTAIIFAVDGFIGASPELLVGRFNDVVGAHPLAGTAPRSSDPVEDQELAAGLEASTKNQAEHRITIDWLLDTLLPFCSYVDAEPEPAIVTLPNVHHLGTRVEGRLSKPAASVLELVAALHPTPAVGGDPQDQALKLIEDMEPGDRGLYAGPVGWVDAAGNGEFAVGIRSARVKGNTASIWAGVGVVSASDPEAELAETRSKFQAMLGALLRP